MADKHIPFGTHPASAMTSAQKVGENETRTFIEAVQLVEDAGWVVLRPEQVRAAPTPDAHSEVGLKVPRYDMYANHDGERAWPSPELAEAGDWVKFADINPAGVVKAKPVAWRRTDGGWLNYQRVGVPLYEHPQTVTIKPLEWREYLNAHTASTPFGALVVRAVAFDENEKHIAYAIWEETEFGTVDAAKAAAQADFAQRVQSCLTAGVVKAEPVAVTDEMVERALVAYFPGEEINLHRQMPDSVMADVAEHMRAALTAALASKPEGER